MKKPINLIATLSAVLAISSVSGAAVAHTRNNFDEYYYIRNNPDVAQAVRRGGFSSGYAHFIKYGRYENRPYRIITNNGNNRWNRDYNYNNGDRNLNSYNRYNRIDNEWELRRRINEIYRQVLNRDADWEGTRHYVNLYYQGWSLAQIQQDIANSQEAGGLGRYRYY